MPVDLYVGGAEHAVLHLLYSRFWHKVLYDIGVVSTKEPFTRLFNQGMILAFSYRDAAGKYHRPEAVVERDGQLLADGILVDQQIEKMSKSRLNVVNPDEVVETYGADATRLYEMFMGPLDVAKPWQMAGVAGVSRFLHRVWRLVVDDQNKLSSQVCATEPSLDIERLRNKTIRAVGEDIEAMRFNTAIAKLMELTNALVGLEQRPRSVVEDLVLLIAPFAPHIAEELWAFLGHDASLAHAEWPSFDVSNTAEAMIEYVVQINGKMRHKIVAPAALSAEALVETVLADPRAATQIEGRRILKTVAVPGRLVNFVLSD